MRPYPEFFKTRLTEPDRDFAEAFEKGVYKQSRGLIRQIGEQILNPRQSPFVLIENQRMAFALVKARVISAVAQRKLKKTVILIRKIHLDHTYYGERNGFQPGEAISYKQVFTTSRAQRGRTFAAALIEFHGSASYSNTMVIENIYFGPASKPIFVIWPLLDLHSCAVGIIRIDNHGSAPRFSYNLKL